MFISGSLRLKDNNPLSHPLIFANYYTHPDDVKVMVEGIKIGLKLAETKGNMINNNIPFLLYIQKNLLLPASKQTIYKGI